MFYTPPPRPPAGQNFNCPQRLLSDTACNCLSLHHLTSPPETAASRDAPYTLHALKTFSQYLFSWEPNLRRKHNACHLSSTAQDTLPHSLRDSSVTPELMGVKQSVLTPDTCQEVMTPAVSPVLPVLFHERMVRG